MKKILILTLTALTIFGTSNVWCSAKSNQPRKWYQTNPESRTGKFFRAIDPINREKSRKNIFKRLSKSKKTTSNETNQTKIKVYGDERAAIMKAPRPRPT